MRVISLALIGLVVVACCGCGNFAQQRAANETREVASAVRDLTAVVQDTVIQLNRIADSLEKPADKEAK